MESTDQAIIVIGTYNRAHLLRRSLECYAAQTHDNLRLIIMDDGSTDETEAICIDAAYNGLKIDYTKLPKEPGTWRDSAAFINAGISKALHHYNAGFVFITHPEIMIGKKVIETGIEVLKENIGTVRVNFKGYYLSIEQQKEIDTVDWKESITNVRNLPDFYKTNAMHDKHPDYTPRAIDRSLIWGSWLFGGFSRAGWERFGGVFESDIWGAVDVEMYERCKTLGVPTITPQQDECYLVHQNHDAPGNVITPRNQDTWMQTLKHKTIEARPHLISAERWESFKINKV